MIEPCLDYKLHFAWSQHNFPKIQNSTRNYLVHLVLGIRTFEDVGRCLTIPPNEWFSKLEGYMYIMYLDSIIELVCIWHFTFGLDEAVPYELYLEHELELKPSNEEVLKAFLKTRGN